ncbi:MAG: cytochrome c biogenesis protein DipZ [Dermatophilaceae bacterium]
MLLTALVSLGAGMLTVLAPCVLPLLPVILGGSVSGAAGDRRRPFVIAGSLVVSLVLFTLLLKASTVLIGVDPRVWTTVSGGLIVVLGLSMLFPGIWSRVSARSGLEHRSQRLLGKAAANGNRTLSAVGIGAALGPVFSSCSPTYAWAIATVLPASPVLGMIYLTLYCLGVGTALLAIALLGRRLLERIRWASNPRGWFARTVAVLFVAVGLSVLTGFDKVVQTSLVDADPIGITRLEQGLVDGATNGTVEMSPADPSAYPAPELTGIQEWVNSEPLTLAGLRGTVVLIDFWTYSCINCQRTQPYLNAWYDRYAADGLRIIGVHAPEFAFEKVPANVQRAVAQAKIAYPVALDNDFATWNVYRNRFWPAKYLIDRDGKVRFTHFGEGAYAETETRIRELLGQSATGAARVQVDAGPASTGARTPETYLGTSRARGYAGSPGLVDGAGATFSPVAALGADQWTLGGRWDVGEQSLTAAADGATLTLRYSGRDVFLVMNGPPGGTVGVGLDGQALPGVDRGPDGTASVEVARLYRLASAGQPLTNATLTLTFSRGVSANAFTFG